MIYLFAVVLLAFTAGPATAQSAGPPAFVVGDTWTLSTGLVRKVEKVEGDSAVISGIGTCKTCLVYFSTKDGTLVKVEMPDGSAPDSVTVGFVPLGKDWKLFDFPVEVGKKWNFRAKGLFRNAFNNYECAVTVEAYEDVTTKAGTFKAFRIKRDFTIPPIDNRGRGFSWTAT